MPRSDRHVEPSADFFKQPETGSHNGVPRPTALPEAEEWEIEALRVAPEIPTASGEDEWDLNALRLSQDFDAAVGGKKLIASVAVRRPKPQEFIRVHPDPAWHLEAALLEVPEERETYLVVPALVPELIEEIQPADLVTAINRSGELFLWPVKRSRSGKRDNAWITSAQEGARWAQTSWVRIKSNRELAAYVILRAAAHYSEPEWPVDLTFSGVVKLAFKDCVIRDFQHPVLRRLRGEI